MIISYDQFEWTLKCSFSLLHVTDLNVGHEFTFTVNVQEV